MHNWNNLHLWCKDIWASISAYDLAAEPTFSSRWVNCLIQVNFNMRIRTHLQQLLSPILLPWLPSLLYIHLCRLLICNILCLCPTWNWWWLLSLQVLLHFWMLILLAIFHIWLLNVDTWQSMFWLILHSVRPILNLYFYTLK